MQECKDSRLTLLFNHAHVSYSGGTALHLPIRRIFKFSYVSPEVKPHVKIMLLAVLN